MTVETTAAESGVEGTTGASFHGVTEWEAIDWKSVNHNVSRLQARIVKATIAQSAPISTMRVR